MALIKRALGGGRGGAHQAAQARFDAHDGTAPQRTPHSSGRKFRRIGLAATSLVAAALPVVALQAGVALAHHPEISVKTECTDDGWTATYTIKADQQRDYTWNIEAGNPQDGQKDDTSFTRTHELSIDQTSDSYSSGLTRWWDKNKGDWVEVASHGGATATADRPEGCEPTTPPPDNNHPCARLEGGLPGGSTTSVAGEVWIKSGSDGPNHGHYSFGYQEAGYAIPNQISVDGKLKNTSHADVCPATPPTTPEATKLTPTVTYTEPTCSAAGTGTPVEQDGIRWVTNDDGSFTAYITDPTKYVWSDPTQARGWNFPAPAAQLPTNDPSCIPPQPSADEKWECSGYYTRGYDLVDGKWVPGAWVRQRDITRDEALNLDGDCGLPPTQEKWDCATGYSTGGYDWTGTEWVPGALVHQRDLSAGERDQLDCDPRAEVVCTSTGLDYVSWQLTNTGNVDISQPVSLAPGASAVIESLRNDQGTASVDVVFANGHHGTFGGSGEDCVFTTVPPTVPPTEPTVPPTEPTVPPTEPTVPPTEPTVPPTEPTVPPTEPTTPTTGPTTTSPATPTVEIVAVGPVCHRDVPYIRVTLGGSSTFDGRAGTVTFVDVNGNAAATHDITFVAGETLDLIYPGATVDAEGNATDWPGWAFVNNLWVPDESDDFLRDGLTVELAVNPTDTATVAYPEATSACAVPENVSSGVPQTPTVFDPEAVLPATR